MLNTNISALIQDQIPDAIAQKRLTPALLELIYKENWFNLWVPKSYGGLGYALTDGCKLLEELAYTDGGFGWTVTLCAGANMFAGFIDPELAQHIFSKPQVCWGGSGKPSGRADKVDGGYRITGEWRYATGAPHLSHFTLNAWLYEHDKPIIDKEGVPVYRSFFVDRDDVLIHYDWDTFGLECTASHSFSVEKLLVGANRAFDLRPEERKKEDPLFYYPFMTFAECTLAVNYMGMFRRFLDLTERYFFVKSSDAAWSAAQGKTLFKLVDQLSMRMENKKGALYTLMAETWGQLKPPVEKINEIAMLSRTIVQLIKEDAIRIFPYLGIHAAQRESEVNIVFRHLFTASQHALLNT